MSSLTSPSLVRFIGVIAHHRNWWNRADGRSHPPASRVNTPSNFVDHSGTSPRNWRHTACWQRQIKLSVVYLIAPLVTLFAMVYVTYLKPW